MDQYAITSRSRYACVPSDYESFSFGKEITLGSGLL